MSLNATKYGLALHTTSPELGLAINNFAEINRAQTWDLGRDLSTQLHQLLAEFIKPQTWQDLAFLAVAKGPGSFTGTRIGIVTARTLAQQLNIPLFAISTTAAIAYQQKLNNPAIPEGTDIAVQMPAQRGQIFGSIYKTSPKGTGILTLLPDSLYNLEQWQHTLTHWANPYHLIFADTHTARSVTSLLQLAYQDWQQGQNPTWAEALPFYGQHPVE
ncbi:tRNA (adenosine(37)-N6)-threonylcarbamoyltransferase complex dimerization subunit type 1 TsaB [Ancylothrix sp. C2]|uniref:tRNA (adenosine(37)-N6)-threonylcarbamoyltransferase complex dimerization subunit type 1 TsaB n=1 Tax=Ancylothrix sp. D3o TaxID=2953691 RepID=UPI0021BA9BEC|nr:tRNA (adenosine(37)-N6)-threonylcarbamoyltransferase complex dimerization subunit type 1 TsaB [Ancylothrix sp. D3o]MCT7951864.1 tRNA (adenosine(37)-N6)-threonylcarbamoyltransferase complex dimerization subunit type 1 TsaB [Ancylothrix sp. D3o]